MVMVVKSKYGGKCPRCWHRYPVGTAIEKIGTNWIPINCQDCIQRGADLESMRKLEERMLAKHNIAFGCWGIPEQAQPTFSPAEFVRRAVAVGEIMPEEKRAYVRYWRGSYHHDLSD